MSSWIIYIAPVRDDGSFSDYVDVSSYAIGNDVGSIKRKTEKDDFDIGVAPNGSINLKFNNSDGTFSEAGNAGSIFTYRRGGSKVRISYLFGETAPICGMAIAGEAILGPETDAFEGFLSEKDLNQNVIDDTVSISVLSFESVFENYESILDNITLALTIELAFYELLNRTEITKDFIVDTANFNLTINPLLSGINSSLDFLEETTLREALDLLLEASASVLYIEDKTVYITDRTPNEGIKYYFYGQASNFGLENIQNISDYKSGLSRTFNIWKWDSTTLTSKDQSSIDLYGVLKHDDLDFKATINTSARQTLLDAHRDEFSVTRDELKLTSFVNVEILGLRLFDKISIDYPNVPIPVGAGNLPIWNTGSMIWRDEDTFDPTKPFFTWPDGLLNIEIEPNKEWKIIGIDTASKKDLITLELREV